MSSIAPTGQVGGDVMFEVLRRLANYLSSSR